MEIGAELLAAVALPGAGWLVGGLALASRGGTHRALLEEDGALVVRDLSRVLAGDPEPLGRFPLPWPGWDRGVHSVSPDGTFAVLSGQRSVRAVDADGRTRWEFPHPCWAPSHHRCAEDEAALCPYSTSGSCLVSADGTVVWAHVRAADDAGPAYEEWVVLDAKDGRPLASTPLDSVAAGSWHLAHPDGGHVGLSIGEGQDGSRLYWGRWDGTTLHTWDLDGPDPLLNDTDRILVDTHPAHRGFLTVGHDQADLALHDLHGEALAVAGAAQIPAAPDTEEPYWDYYCGFADADHVIAGTVEYDTSEYDDPQRARHWLLDAHSLHILGRIRYPEPNDSFVRPLGDGTWLTATDDVLRRWRPGPIPRTGV